MNIKEEIREGISSALANLGMGTGKPAPGPVAPTADSATFSPEQLGVLKAALALGIDTPEKLSAMHSASKKEENPVLTAALAAGCDTAEKFTQLAAEAKAGREALPGAREDAHAGAVAYFGTNADGLKAAKDLINGETSFSQLNSLTEKYWAGAPGAERPEKRLSQPGSPSPTDQKNAAQKEKDLAARVNASGISQSGTTSESSAPFDYYAQFNGKKAAQ